MTTTTVHLTLHSIDAITSILAGDDLSWLSAQERARWHAISAVRRRTEFVAGRWLARQCLAAKSGGCWHDYVLSAPDGGAPTVLAAPALDSKQGRYFSLSHSADCLACVVSTHPVGVDVEDSTRQRDTDALGELIYGAQERVWVDAMPIAMRREQFFALWTLKEAWIKQTTHAAAFSRSMRDAQFRPCATSAPGAVVLRGGPFTLAVVSSCSIALSCDAPELTRLSTEPWEVLADKSD